ncbi:hypothetical protein [Epilithonimonas mollis]|nr:hypothetical protein [Epilithonimonas mollis]
MNRKKNVIKLSRFLITAMGDVSDAMAKSQGSNERLVFYIDELLF